MLQNKISQNQTVMFVQAVFEDGFLGRFTLKEAY